jgi:hypothetical protein
MTQTTDKRNQEFQKWRTGAKNAAKSVATKFNDEKDGIGLYVATILGATILTAIAWKVFSINVRPYAIVMGDTLPQPSRVPIIGWAWDLLNIAYYCTGAFLAWFVTQFFQASWIAISLDRKALRSAIRKSRKELDRQDTEGSKQDRTTRKAARTLSKIPFAYRYWSAYLALGFFVVEVLVNFKAYPPVAVDRLSEFWLRASVGDYGLLDWSNIAQMLWSLFSTELVIVAIVIFWQYIAHRNSAD